MAVCEELRGFASATLSLPPLKDPVICPKPRRVGHFANHPSLSMRWCIRSAHAEQVDSQAGSELLDLIRAKEGRCIEDREVASSPLFFSGSPPTRVSNPIVQDVNFGNEKKLSPFSTLQFLTSASSSSLGSPTAASPSSLKGGCARMKFGLKPAEVRIEGFNCLSRDHQNSGISAVA